MESVDIIRMCWRCVQSLLQVKVLLGIASADYVCVMRMNVILIIRWTDSLSWVYCWLYKICFARRFVVCGMLFWFD